MKRRALVGLVLCTTILASAYPLLFGLEAYPRQVFYGDDAYSITPATSATVLNDTFVSSILDQSWDVVVSPEVYVFTTWCGIPAVARGVNVTAFLAIEDASIVAGTWDGDFALAGEGFASTHDVSIGDSGVLAGSNAPGIESITVTGLFRSSGPASDEILIPMVTARKLAPYYGDHVSAIRLRTSDSDAMMDFLRSTDLALAVSSDYGTVYLNTPLGGDGRLSSLAFLYPELWSELGRGFVHSFAQQGINGVRVVILVLVGLITTLAVLGIYSVVWRATDEASRPVGVLRVLGAPPKTVTAALLREFLTLGSLAMFAGLAIGSIIAFLAGAFGVFHLFAHSISPQFDVLLAVEVYLIVLCTTVLSVLIRARAGLKRPPRELIAAIEPKRETLPEEELPI